MKTPRNLRAFSRGYDILLKIGAPCGQRGYYAAEIQTDPVEALGRSACGDQKFGLNEESSRASSISSSKCTIWAWRSRSSSAGATSGGAGRAPIWTAPLPDQMGMLATVINSLGHDGRHRTEGRSHTRADGAQHDLGRRALRPSQGASSLRKGAHRHHGVRHGQPVLLDGHRRRPARLRNKSGRFAHGKECGRHLRQRPALNPDAKKVRQAHVQATS